MPSYSIENRWMGGKKMVVGKTTRKTIKFEQQKWMNEKYRTPGCSLTSFYANATLTETPTPREDTTTTVRAHGNAVKTVILPTNKAGVHNNRTVSERGDAEWEGIQRNKGTRSLVLKSQDAKYLVTVVRKT